MLTSDLGSWREEFPTISQEEIVHLNHCMVSPLPQRAIDARRECERKWQTAHPHPWDEWYDKIDEARERFADLINADTSEIAVVPSVTQAVSQIASAFNSDGGQEVVMTEMEFPSMWQFWDAQQRQRDVSVLVAESTNGRRITEDGYAEAITDDTDLVTTSHAFSATGGTMEPKAVADLVHDRGGYLFLDAYQSAGIVPIDVDEQDVDMLATGTTKFLVGGPGAAFLYVDSELITDLEPSTLGWFSSDERFEVEDPDYAEDATRFQLGTPPITNMYQVSAGLSVIQEVGVETINQAVGELTDHLITGAEERGFTTATPKDADLRTGIVNVKVEDYEGTCEKIVDDGFRLSYIESRVVDSGIRFSPHFYTTHEEIEAALDALEEHATPHSG